MPELPYFLKKEGFDIFEFNHSIYINKLEVDLASTYDFISSQILNNSLEDIINIRIEVNKYDYLLPDQLIFKSLSQLFYDEKGTLRFLKSHSR